MVIATMIYKYIEYHGYVAMVIYLLHAFLLVQYGQDSFKSSFFFFFFFFLDLKQLFFYVCVFQSREGVGGWDPWFVTQRCSLRPPEAGGRTSAHQELEVRAL